MEVGCRPPRCGRAHGDEDFGVEDCDLDASDGHDLSRERSAASSQDWICGGLVAGVDIALPNRFLMPVAHPHSAFGSVQTSAAPDGISRLDGGDAEAAPGKGARACGKLCQECAVEPRGDRANLRVVFERYRQIWSSRAPCARGNSRE